VGRTGRAAHAGCVQGLRLVAGLLARAEWRTRALPEQAGAPSRQVGRGQFLDPKTEAGREALQRFTPNLIPEQRAAVRDKMKVYDYAHFDSLAAALRYGHQIGLQIHAWISINEDDHGWGLQSEFSKRHPECRWRRRDGRPYFSQLSFAFPGVRKYKLAILKELLRKYPIDGLFLDWIRTGDVRDNPQTDADGVADSGYEKPLIEKFKATFGVDPREVPNGDERWVRLRSEPQTEFMRAVRKLARSQKRPVSIAVMLGHPGTIGPDGQD